MALPLPMIPTDQVEDVLAEIASAPGEWSIKINDRGEIFEINRRPVEGADS